MLRRWRWRWRWRGGDGGGEVEVEVDVNVESTSGCETVELMWKRVSVYTCVGF